MWKLKLHIHILSYSPPFHQPSLSITFILTFLLFYFLKKALLKMQHQIMPKNEKIWSREKLMKRWLSNTYHTHLFKRVTQTWKIFGRHTRKVLIVLSPGNGSTSDVRRGKSLFFLHMFVSTNILILHVFFIIKSNLIIKSVLSERSNIVLLSIMPEKKFLVNYCSLI